MATLKELNIQSDDVFKSCYDSEKETVVGFDFNSQEDKIVLTTSKFGNRKLLYDGSDCWELVRRADMTPVYEVGGFYLADESLDDWPLPGDARVQVVWQRTLGELLTISGSAFVKHRVWKNERGRVLAFQVISLPEEKPADQPDDAGAKIAKLVERAEAIADDLRSAIAAAKE